MSETPEINKMFGNRFWEARSKHGRDAIISDPKKLEEACIEYFTWVVNNPLKEEKVGFTSNGAVHTDVNKLRAMTIDGLAVFLGISRSTWYEWKENRKDLSDIIAWAEGVMREQKITGAAAGLLNASIVVRDLGMSETTAIQHLDSEGEKADAPGTCAAKEIAAAVHAEFRKTLMEEAANDTENSA